MYGMNRELLEGFLSEDPWNCIEYMLDHRPESILEYLEQLDDTTGEVTEYKSSMGVTV